MPDLDLDAIEARIAAATPGPWIHGDRWHIQGASKCPCRPEYGPLIHSGPMDINGEVMPSHVHERPEPSWNRGIWLRPTAETEWAPELVVLDEAETLLDADADLIAHAPSDLAALVAEMKRLRAVAEAARESREAERDTHYTKDDLSQTIASLDRAREAERKLDAALDALDAGGEES